ncbi:MAG: HlyD family secretion protein [Chitinophagaceae bacterium]|jgi:membrane fusion protein (multidrug efflux system)|nr:HlyD family secretion protein [Chitinophagaceae bacterium]
MKKENVEPEKKKSPVRYIILGIILIAGAIFGYTKIHYALTHETTDDAQVETDITPVLTRVSGYVKSINIKDYDTVKEGQLVAVIDDSDLQTELAQMQADYSQSEAEIQTAKASLNNTVVALGTSKGIIDLNQVKLQQAQEDFERNENLFKDQAITQKQLNDSRFALEAAKQQVLNSHSDLGTGKSRVAVMEAGIQKAEAELASKKAKIDQQKLKLSYTEIYAPISGKAGKKNVVAGQYIQAGNILFSIVSDTTFWIVANFKETQIQNLKDGMEVKIALDAYPDKELKGKIVNLSAATGAKIALLPPDNASGNFVKVTQRVPIKISIDSVAHYRNILRAGLSANISISTK